MQIRAPLPVPISVMFTTLLLVYCTLFRINLIPVVHNKHTVSVIAESINFSYRYIDVWYTQVTAKAQDAYKKNNLCAFCSNPIVMKFNFVHEYQIILIK